VVEGSPHMPSDSGSLVGRVVDGAYRIEELLGRGAVGAVYRAVELSSGRVVALKQWRKSAFDEQVRGRFEREVGALASLDHPNIVKVLGRGIVDDVPYLALEHLEGQTLGDLLAHNEPLPTDLALDIARQALAAVAYAHERNVVHRDLKPDNIFLCKTTDGRVKVKILDYGLAKFMSDAGDPKKDVQLTMTGMVMGTPLYMPPEQAAGSSVDLPVDVYALGCVLFEMLTGQLPFVGETTMELLAAHLRAPIPKITDVRKDATVAPELQAVIDQALAKKQVQRFPNAAAMLAALEAVPAQPITLGASPAAQSPARKPAPGPSAPATSGLRREHWPWLAAGALVLFALSTALFVLLH